MGSVGLPGVLITRLFSNSIGAADNMLNGITAATVKDFISSTFGKQLTESQQNNMTIYLFLGYSLLSIGLMHFITNLDGLLQTLFGIVRVTGGIGLGALILEAFFPWANSKGLIGGTISSIIYMALVMHNGLQVASYGYSDSTRNFSADECINNDTTKIPSGSLKEMISSCEGDCMWQTSISMIIFIITGIIISGITGFQNPKELDKTHLSPSAKWIFNHLPHRLKMALNLPYYNMVNENESLPAEE